ncbi:MAG: penicillin-binding protein 1C [Sphingobacteriaceae bacterium]|nr:penicillin-binding protein 1C [Sphingobacteriaceae bacterium]
MSFRKKAIILICTAVALSFWFLLPKHLFNTPTSFVIESREGILLGASIAKDGQWRFPQSDSLPKKFKKCIVAFEDKRFYYHPGIDLLALSRAIRLNLKKGRVVSGGSTITMQTIRLATGSRRTFFNKTLEAIKALRLELRYSKEEILSLYASNAPFGTNVVGLDAAAWRYFGRRPEQLSWGEMAALAVLPNSPSMVHPGKKPEILLKKRNKLIDILAREQVLSAAEAKLAKLEPVPGKPFPLPQSSPHLLNLIRNDYNKNLIASTKVQTSVSYRLNKQVNDILLQHHSRLTANEVNNCAALILDVETGKAIAYAGNVYQPQNISFESYVDIIQAPRSPGSTLKPLLYAAMLNEGSILPNSLIPDIPTQIAGYQPNNYDLGYDGAVPASKALARSLNVPAVKMLQQYRYEKMHAFLKDLGISTLNNPPDFYGLSLILGGCETTMWELAGVYASMARVLNNYTTHTKYSNTDWRKPSYQQGSTIKSTLEEKNGKLSAASIYFTFQAMNEVMRPGEELLWRQFSSSQQIAWKTGTSFGFRDGWAIGVTPRYVVAVWAGNADGEGRPGLTGIDAAAPVMFDIFRLLPKSEGWFKVPLGELTEIGVCAESGFRASDLCTSPKKTAMPRSGLKAAVCSYHKLVHLDRTGQWQVSSDCEQPSLMTHKSWFVLPPAMEYYFKTKNYSYQTLPAFKPDCSDAGSYSNPMELIYPRNNAKIYVPLEIDGKRGQVIFNAAHRRTGEVIYWHLDNNYISSTRDLHQIALNPAPGNHTITLIDKEGNRLSQSFTILAKENI